MLNKWLVILILQFLGWKFLFKYQDFVIFWYKYVTQSYNQIVYYITSRFSFPIGELFYILLIFVLILIIFQFFKSKKLSNKFSLLFKCLSIVLFIYNSLWGIVNYKINFNGSNIELNGLKVLYNNSLNELNCLRQTINPIENKPLEFVYENEYYINDIRLNLNKLEKENWINNFNIPKELVVKHSNFSSLLSQFGILGYYNPFTVESNINCNNSDLKTSFTISHELAHQMGFATENEANFIAYYLGVNSNIKEVQYAAHFKTTFSLLNAIYPHDSIYVKNELENLPEGIKVDREAEIEYYKQFDGSLNDLFSIMNNQFLKANNQEGLVSYSKYIELVYFYNLNQNKKANQY